MTTAIPSKEYILSEFNRVQAIIGAEKNVTREQFRKLANVSTSHVELHFGTFAELRRQAGASPTRADSKLLNAVARAATVGRRDDLIAERDAYGEDYLRTDESRYKTLLVASDLHDKEIDPFFLRVFLDTAKRVQPETVVLGGDVFDLPEFGRYNVDPREWDAVGRIKFTHNNILEPLRNAVPDAQIDLIEGNHECITEDTEVLTKEGWMTSKAFHELFQLGHAPKIASFDLNTDELWYGHAVETARQTGREILELESLFKHEKVTGNHNLVTKYNGLATVDHLQTIGGLRGEYLKLSMNKQDCKDPLELEWNIVRLAVWLSSTASIMRRADGSPYLLFHKIHKRVRRRVKAVVHNIPGLKWHDAGESLEVDGSSLPGLLEVITGANDQPHNTRWAQTPDWLERLPNEYGKIIAEELAYASTQQFMSTHTSYFNGHGHHNAEAWQMFLVMRGIPCTINKLPNGQYVLIFVDTGEPERGRGRKIKVKNRGMGAVISIQTRNKTLITRYNGRINFTGNCRLVKHLADFSPATRAILGDLHGMTIGDLFGLRKFEINYVAKADLKAYTAKEHDKELENNYRIYYDNVLVHHFPHARHMGMPGVNGHHHRHQVWPMFNLHQGAYEWHQLGAGHKRSASYCEGERWHTGFALIHVDTLTKSVNIEYVPVTNMAVVGGKFYTRETSELIV